MGVVDSALRAGRSGVHGAPLLFFWCLAGDGGEAWWSGEGELVDRRNLRRGISARAGFDRAWTLRDERCEGEDEGDWGWEWEWELELVVEVSRALLVLGRCTEQSAERRATCRSSSEGRRST